MHRRTSVALVCLTILFAIGMGVLVVRFNRLENKFVSLAETNVALADASSRSIPLRTPQDLAVGQSYHVTKFFSATLSFTDDATDVYFVLVQDPTIQGGYNDMAFVVLPKLAVHFTDDQAITPTNTFALHPVQGEGDFGLAVFFNAATIRPDPDPEFRLVAAMATTKF